MKARVALIALAFACAHESASTGAAPAATVQQVSSAAAQGAPAQPAAPAAPGATAAPAIPGSESAVPAPSTDAATQPAGSAATKHSDGPPGGTSTAAQTALPSAPAAPAVPLMPDEAFRDQPPKPFASQPRFQAPKPVERKLKNGARVLVVTNHSVPLVAIDVRFLHGIDAEPAGKGGLASYVADMVDEGTESRTSEKLSIEIEDLAAHISAGASLESTTAHLNCLVETLPQALDIFADIIQHPAFRKEDVDRVRTLRLTSLAQKKASANAIAGDEAARILYGDKHPWGQPAGGTPQSLTAIDRQDLVAFHRAFWVPNDAIISVSGDVTPDQIVKLLNEKFAGWTPHPVMKLHLPKIPALGPRSIDALEKANTTQSQVWVLGRLFAAHLTTDSIPLRVANMTLGGLFSSRLNMNLREKNGYSYGVSSGVSLMRSVGTFSASGSIIGKKTVEAVAEYEKELSTFADGEVTEQELASAKEALIRGIPSALETNDAVSGAMANLVSLGLPLDYYQTVAGRIAKVSRADVKRVVTKWVKPKQWPILIVGPVGASKEALEKLSLGPVRLSPAGGGEPGASK